MGPVVVVVVVLVLLFKTFTNISRKIACSKFAFIIFFRVGSLMFSRDPTPKKVLNGKLVHAVFLEILVKVLKRRRRRRRTTTTTTTTGPIT